ncbi:MAG: L,D-transpeptidase family protein [Alphaproteobacteria bacterium]|nr:L,D-transpeptidase family protein [Alphaproteobacteria bacterium]
MHVVVHPVAVGRGRLLWSGREVPCTLGRGGVRRDKREGDGATPVGRYPFRSFYWRPDRFAVAPPSALPGEALTPQHGWCDAPDHAAYNRPVRLPFAASHERLWRDDALYDVIVVLGHNDAPVVPHAGSAIFMHLMRDDGGPTDGCVGLARSDLLELLAALGPGAEITFEPIPA